MAQNDKIQLFENKRIRTVWDEEKEEWYFSILIHALPKMPFRSVFTSVGLLFFKCGKECFCDRIIERCAAC